MSYVPKIGQQRLTELREVLAKHPRLAFRIPREEAQRLMGYRPPVDQLCKRRVTDAMKSLGFQATERTYNGKRYHFYELGKCNRYIVTRLRFEKDRIIGAELVNMDEWVVGHSPRRAEPAPFEKITGQVPLETPSFVPRVLSAPVKDPWLVRLAWALSNSSGRLSIAGLGAGIALGLVLTGALSAF